MDKGENQLANRLMEVFAQFKRLHMKHSPIDGLTPGEVMLLIRLSKLTRQEEQGMKVSDLSFHMRVMPPSITQLINTLEAGGYVERSMDRSDRRAVRVKLTKKGQEVVARANEVFSRRISGLIEYLGEEKSKELIDIMEKVYGYFQGISDNSDCNVDGR
jgi:DNA-binding MarR family transcriptional regulator